MKNPNDEALNAFLKNAKPIDYEGVQDMMVLCDSFYLFLFFIYFFPKTMIHYTMFFHN